jgi:hypothetical protein
MLGGDCSAFFSKENYDNTECSESDPCRFKNRHQDQAKRALGRDCFLLYLQRLFSLYVPRKLGEMLASKMGMLGPITLGTVTQGALVGASVMVAIPSPADFTSSFEYSARKTSPLIDHFAVEPF